MSGVALDDQTLAPYREAYETQARAGGEWLRALRRRAFERFAERGFPTSREERYRHTSLAELARVPFAPPATSGTPASSERLRQLAFDGALADQQVVLLNGNFVPELSTLHPAAGVVIRRLADVLAEGGIAGRVGVIDGPERRSPLADLNTAMLADGAYVEVAAGAAPQTAIHILHLSAVADEIPTLSHPRLLVALRAGARATLVETFGGSAGQVYLTNAVTEVALEEGAALEHLRLQRESERGYHVATLAVRQERGSRYANRSIMVGGQLARLDIDCVLAGEDCETILDGLFVGDQQQRLDTHTRVEHATKRGTSRQLYKGLMSGASRGVFNGLVLVKPGAIGTDAQQTNRNLLLSPEALVHSTPQLEIFADDVKCKHGSTTGQIDAAALFYLRSRGIGESEARSLLAWAFSSDLVGRLTVPAVRASLAAFLQARLPGAPREVMA